MKDYLQQVSPNNWSCLPTAFAKLFNVPVGDIFNYLEHDGSTRVFASQVLTTGEDAQETLSGAMYADSLTRRAFHLQEMIHYAYNVHQTLVVQIEKEPVSTNGKELYELYIKPTFIYSYLEKHDGVIICENKITMHQHAVTWYKGLIYDPSGKVYTLDEFTKIFKIHAFLLTYQMSPPCG